MESPQGEIAGMDGLILEAEELVERRSAGAMPLVEQIMRMALQSGNPKHYGQANYILAFYHCLVANNYDRSIALCTEILQNLEEDELSGVIYKVYMTLGNSYQLKGDIFSAEKSYMKGLRQLENQPELNRIEKGFLASFYYNLSYLLSSSALNISAEEYLDKATLLYAELGNLFKLSKSYVAQGCMFEKKKEHVKAIEVLHKALEIDLGLKDAYSIALTKANLGTNHLRLNEHEKAFAYLKESLCYYEAGQMPYEAARVKLNFAEAQHASGAIEEAICNLLECEKLFIRQNNLQELNQVFELLALYYDEMHNFKEALHYHRKYTDGLKYFFNVEKTNALTRAKNEFETDQKEKEAAILRSKNEEIKHYVVKLEQSNNQLHQFASVASHDLREPLRMISSYISLLQRNMSNQVNSQQAEFMEFIKDGAKRMDQLITDLLQLAKVDANPRPETVDLNMVLQEIKWNLAVLVKEKNAHIIYPELPKVTADRAMILQLFQNLVGNGMKYNQSSSPVVKVNWRLTGTHLEITVSDNGIGIPENLREKAFQIFQRLHTNKQYSGTGIGLSICRKVVESMNGTITIGDMKGGGSVFTILLPTEILTSTPDVKGEAKVESYSLLPLLDL